MSDKSLKRNEAGLSGGGVGDTEGGKMMTYQIVRLGPRETKEMERGVDHTQLSEMWHSNGTIGTKKVVAKFNGGTLVKYTS